MSEQNDTADVLHIDGVSTADLLHNRAPAEPAGSPCAAGHSERRRAHALSAHPRQRMVSSFELEPELVANTVCN